MSRWVKRDKKRQYAPEVVVEGLKLGKVTVEGRDILRSYTPVRADLQNITWNLSDALRKTLHSIHTRHNQVVLVLVE